MPGHDPPLWRFLGEPSIRWHGKELTPLIGRKAVALLAYLTLSPEGAGRHEVAALLWPPGDAARSMHSLRQCLVSLRRALGDEFEQVLSVSDSWLALDRTAVTIDVLRLIEIDAGAAATADEVTDLCRGPFLCSLVTRAAPFDDWAAVQRDRFATLMHQALRRALASANNAGRSGEAARIRARVAELGPVPLTGASVEILPAVMSGPAGHHESRVRAAGLARRGRLRGATLFLGGALVAAGALWGAYLVSDDFRGLADRLLLGESVTPRIAVMPFTSLNGTAEETGLAGGVTLGVTYALYAITARELFVVTPAAADDARQLAPGERIAYAKELGVRFLISGSLGVEGDIVRVYVQCLDAKTGVDIWQDSFDQPKAQTFKQQDKITRRILDELDIELSPAEWNRIDLIGDTDNLKAWLLAANGVRHLIKVNRRDVELARKFYAEAQALDPNYVSARRGLAWVALLSVRLGWAEDPVAAIVEAKSQLDVVLRKEMAQNAEGPKGTTKSLEGLILLLEGRYDEAVAAGIRATELLPGSADVWAVLAHTLTFVGEHERALEMIENAMERSKIHPGWYRWTKARALRMAGRMEESVEILKRDLDPAQPVLIHLVELATSYSAAGRLEDARRVAARIRQIDPRFSPSSWVQHPPIRVPDIQTQEFQYLSDAFLGS
jgi:TolB-like protein